MPMYRQIEETPCEVSFYERLYAPADDNGKLLPTLGEAIHRSVITRYGKQAGVCSNDKDAVFAKAAYTPKNLVPFFSTDGKLKPNVSVAD